MITGRYCDNWNPKGTVFCPRCGFHRYETVLIDRRLNWQLWGFLTLGTSLVPGRMNELLLALRRCLTGRVAVVKRESGKLGSLCTCFHGNDGV